MKEFDQLVQIVADLRKPEGGCPWDKKQTHASLVPNFIEELYEGIEAIEDGDMQDLREELGDLMLHIVMQSRIAEEDSDFTMAEVLQGINDKLVRRHPHIFGTDIVKDAEEVKMNWEQIKLKEKTFRKSALEGVPQGMPKLIVAQRMQEKAAAVGFDWDHHGQVFEKLDEEVIELKEAIESGDQEHIMEELGDLLFTVVNLSRKLGIDAESALSGTNRKFERRFRQVEEIYKSRKEKMHDSSLEQLDEVWETVKDTEK
ncbi:MAG: nucleoside triphosphate pyrophosphohydrolase [Candidatus Cloacimonetes bacterium]|nr:nucleoside triphosphate pyrophosphohydrolase [Candidatus Cloacimonadota bacterium]